MKKEFLVKGDCMEYMRKMPSDYADLTITDIPYGVINRNDNGLRSLNKENADVETFELNDFLEEVTRVTKGTVIVFCSIEQLSCIGEYFYSLQKNKKGTMRQIVWTKSNPSPMNGEYIYLSSVENAIWFKKKGAAFNARCKKNYFLHPCGKSKFHPTEKNHELLKELILDNSNEGDMVFDPCAGSGSHLLVARENNRKICGFEINDEYYKIAKERVYAAN